MEIKINKEKETSFVYQDKRRFFLHYGHQAAVGSRGLFYVKQIEKFTEICYNELDKSKFAEEK